MKDGRIYQIKTGNNNEKIIKLGRFNSAMFKESLERGEKEALGFCVMGYTENPNLPTLIFFGENKNEIRGRENLEKSGVVYINIYNKKGHKWIMKISALKKEVK